MAIKKILYSTANYLYFSEEIIKQTGIFYIDSDNWNMRTNEKLIKCIEEIGCKNAGNKDNSYGNSRIHIREVGINDIYAIIDFKKNGTETLRKVGNYELIKSIDNFEEFKIVKCFLLKQFNLQMEKFNPENLQLYSIVNSDHWLMNSNWGIDVYGDYYSTIRKFNGIMRKQFNAKILYFEKFVLFKTIEEAKNAFIWYITERILNKIIE